AQREAEATALKKKQDAALKAEQEEAARRAKQAQEAAAAEQAKQEAERAAEAKAKADADAKAKAAADAKAKADADAKAKAAAEVSKAVAAAEEARKNRKTTDHTRACEERLTAAAQDGVILFKRAKADIDPGSSLTIARLAEIIKSCPGARVEVSGHTDNEGEPDRNQRLSDRRARAVVKSLVYAGVPVDRLSAVGFGAERPVADNSTPEGMARNRRIEFRVFTD
uniref:OmpA family protein n=1 Tax=uncultured Hyphomicrobium sp. TaxID=194373 RepID=UPI0025EADF0E